MKTKLLIFGITGDLSRRKLLPALNAIIKTGQFDDLEIIGVSRGAVNVGELLKKSIGDDGMSSKLSVFSMDLAQASDYDKLREFIALNDNEQLLVYLSVPPTASSRIVEFLGDSGLNTSNVKLLFEKPFGVDLASATDVIMRTARHFKEDQIYRIDHYLAKEMAQNIVAFRGGNALFSRIWDAKSIEKIEIVALETIGIEGRAQFYEQTGALRDLVQGHLMQLLALTLMEVPDDFNWDELPVLRAKALQAIKTIEPSDAFRAQYETYQSEAQNPGSLTETFVSLNMMSLDERWKDVPITLTTGKGLNKKTTEVRIHLRKRHDAQSNCLTFNIQPNEGVAIELFTKKPGYDREFETQKLSFNFPEDVVLPDAYEQVIVDAIRSQKSLFTSSEEVLQSWRVLHKVQDAWGIDNQPLPRYANGAVIDEILK